VTNIPGTTRDLVEESLNLRGIPIVLIDTAGIRQTEDIIEAIGVERSHNALEQADLILFALDASQPLTQEDYTLANIIAGRTVIVVENKQDLLPTQSPVVRNQSPVTSHQSTLLPNAPHISVSALTGTGIEKLEEQIWRLVIGGQAGTNEATLVTNPRHKQAIQQARDHITDALESAQLGMPADFLTIDLHAAVNALGEITGETATDDLLNAIFSRFCIGK
jgi:tRNA modification GTPase